MKSTNDQQPFFGPQRPVYPQKTQFVRVVSQIGPRLYRGFVQQCLVGASVVFRDREAALLTDPNGTGLGQGIYDCRLVDSLPDPTTGVPLPLYATACCVPSGGFSSSSSSSH